MRVLLLCLCPLAAAWAQPKDISFQQVADGVFSGFSADAQAEKTWEAKAKVMRPGPTEGVWEMDEIRLQSFRSGRPQALFTSPSGVMHPARRAAQGVAEVRAKSAAFDLTGRGWSWRSTAQGDSFAVLADVVADLDLAKPAAQRLRLRAPRMDATPVPGGTLMVFQGGVVAERVGERTTCARLECLVSDGPDGDATCRSMVARGHVVRVLGKQTLRGDSATFDPRLGSAELVGRVEIEEPEIKGSAHRLRHLPKAGLTELFSGDGRTVKLRLRRVGAEVADLSGRRIDLHRDAASGDAWAEVTGDALYVSPQARLTARRVVAREGRAGLGDLLAEGAVKGRLGGWGFTSGLARWDRQKRFIEFSEKPRLREARGLEAAGRSIRHDLLNDRLEIRSDRKSTRLNSSHVSESRMPSSA